MQNTYLSFQYVESSSFFCQIRKAVVLIPFIITCVQVFFYLLYIRIISLTISYKKQDNYHIKAQVQYNNKDITISNHYAVQDLKYPQNAQFFFAKQQKKIFWQSCNYKRILLFGVFDYNFIEMDPRPFNYQYRRPRPDNLTYQSYHAGQSLYHMGRQQYYNSNNILKNEHAERINRYSPNYSNPYRQDHHEEYNQRKGYCEMGVNTENKVNKSVSSNHSQRSKSSASSNSFNHKKQQASILSNYGNSLNNKQVSPMPSGVNMNIVYRNINDTSMIFRKQQKPFDIINLYSRPPQPLKVFPKLTRQHLFYDQEGFTKVS